MAMDLSVYIHKSLETARNGQLVVSLPRVHGLRHAKKRVDVIPKEGWARPCTLANAHPSSFWYDADAGH